MEYFKSGLKTVLGAPQPGVQPSGAETVERLVERVQSSTLLDDRRDACRALKALSRKYRVEVGAQGMYALCQILEMDHNDCEIVGYVLDTLCNITSPEVFEEEEGPELDSGSLSHVGEQFTEMFTKKAENVTLVLGLMEEYEFQVRWPAVKLLTTLLANRPRDIQDIILVSPMGVSKMMDLLGDSRDVIRNEALLLLIQLTKSNANIQKIVAFENAFDRLFDVIREEGGVEGGIVVEDCLLLMLNLLRNNSSNQNFFKEGSYIQRLAPMFTLPPDGDDSGWSAQKVANVHRVLQLVRTLVSPGNPAQVCQSCQRALHASGIVEALCQMLMAGGVPVDVLTETIAALAEAIRGHHNNQTYFGNVLAPSSPPREAIVVLLMSMVNEKQPFRLRCAVLYCFQCFLFQNEDGQRRLVKTLLPSSTEAVSLSGGQLLCGGLFSHDPLSNWFSAVALSHLLIENPSQREELLRVLLAAVVGNAPVSLMHQITLLMQQSSKVQCRLGLLILLCTWLSHCPAAVKHFLCIPSSIPYLTAQAGSTERDDDEELAHGLCAFLLGICVQFNDDSVPNYTKENLRHLIEKRIGHETFVSVVGEVSRHEQYSRAGKHPELRPNSPHELLLDYEFCKLFKALEGMIIKTVTAGSADLPNGGMDLSAAESAMVLQYKELIREQDKRLSELRVALDAAKGRNAELETSVHQLRDQNTVLRAQVSSGGVPDNNETAELRKELENKDAIIQRLTGELNEARLCSSFQKIFDTSNSNSEEVGALRQELAEAQQTIAELRQQTTELGKLRQDQDDLLELLADQDAKLGDLKLRLRALGQKVDEDEELDEEVEMANRDHTSLS